MHNDKNNIFQTLSLYINNLFPVEMRARISFALLQESPRQQMDRPQNNIFVLTMPHMQGKNSLTML